MYRVGPVRRSFCAPLAVADATLGSPMRDDPPAADPVRPSGRPSGRARLVRMAVVFVLVVVVAALVGRLGSGVDQGPAAHGEPTVSAVGAG